MFQLSKAAMLQKGADYIRQLRTERSQLHDEMESLRQQIECLNTAIRYTVIITAVLHVNRGICLTVLVSAAVKY